MSDNNKDKGRNETWHEMNGVEEKKILGLYRFQIEMDIFAIGELKVNLWPIEHIGYRDRLDMAI